MAASQEPQTSWILLTGPPPPYAKHSLTTMTTTTQSYESYQDRDIALALERFKTQDDATVDAAVQATAKAMAATEAKANALRGRYYEAMVAERNAKEEAKDTIGKDKGLTYVSSQGRKQVVLPSWSVSHI